MEKDIENKIIVKPINDTNKKTYKEIIIKKAIEFRVRNSEIYRNYYN